MAGRGAVWSGHGGSASFTRVVEGWRLCSLGREAGSALSAARMVGWPGMVSFASRSWRVGLCNGGFCKFQVGGWRLCSLCESTVGSASPRIVGGWGLCSLAGGRGVLCKSRGVGHGGLCKFAALLEGGGSAVLGWAWCALQISRGGGHGVLCLCRGWCVSGDLGGWEVSTRVGMVALLEGGGSAVCGGGALQSRGLGMVGCASFRVWEGGGSAVRAGSASLGAMVGVWWGLCRFGVGHGVLYKRHCWRVGGAGMVCSVSLGAGMVGGGHGKTAL